MVVFILAWRNIWRNKVRSLIIMGSVALGLVAGLFVLSLYKGMMADRVRMVIDTEVAHLQTHHREFKEDFDARFVIPDKVQLLKTLATNRAVSAVAARTITHGMVATATGSSGIAIIGVDLPDEDEVSRLNAKIREGTPLDGSKKNRALIGRKLATKMHLRLNSKVILTFTDKESNIVSAAFRVGGIYETDNAPRDERTVYVRRTELNSLLSVGDDFHELAIILHSDDSVDEAKAWLKANYPELQVEKWEELSTETKLMLDTTDEYSTIFIGIIMIALSFGIVNSMLMAVLERSREIGMLIAIGMTRLRVFSMMLVETVLLTLTGAPAGILITWLIVAHYHRSGLDISALGGKAMSSFGFSPIIYPAFPWERITHELTIVVLAAVAASLFPAIKAIRLRPVEALQK